MPGKLLWIKTDSEKPGGLIAPKHDGDAGFDMVVSDFTSVDPKSFAQIPCGFKIALPEGVSALVLPRSSSVRMGMLVFTTLIDSCYRGEMFTMAYNLSDLPLHIQPGTRIAQLLPIDTLATGITLCELVSEDLLPASSRGDNGFGSTGK
jgi:dUTP pyrophosphatase